MTKNARFFTFSRWGTMISLSTNIFTKFYTTHNSQNDVLCIGNIIYVYYDEIYETEKVTLNAAPLG